MVLRIIVQGIIPIIICISIIRGESYQNKISNFKIGLIKYEPGDWNSDQTALSELIDFINENTNIPIMPVNRDVELKVKIGSNNFFKTKYIYMTGHGELRGNGWQGLKLKSNEIQALRTHLLNGGFLHVDDNYNFDKTFFPEIKKVFPEKDWVELSNEHNIFKSYYQITDGLPKIHKHDNKKPKALALFHNEKIIVLYTLESDLGDGWESNEEHQRITGKKLSVEKRMQALKMGTNILVFALSQ
tara:strand:- start:7552 stop:8283 length:732 start_codon:yes stop_codon:yes gene_type:complete